jgi:hypothetical protein
LSESLAPCRAGFDGEAILPLKAMSLTGDKRRNAHEDLIEDCFDDLSIVPEPILDGW